MADVQPESALDEAMTLIQGWLDGKLILSRAAVCTLLTEMQRLRAQPTRYMVIPYVEYTDEERQAAEAALEEALRSPHELRVLPPFGHQWDAGSYQISGYGDIVPPWVRVRHLPCDKLIFGKVGDPDALDAAELLKLITEHHCETGQ